ncbi:hypothetical protein COLO4_16526 [Corchorus olitorius]|uniref:Uncharacterized protein n=1 Tax=Corchorus olitorius TaxID=93759 RepID=A0A1R3JH24_9ROSI|nr:hypothetical protein COLO4_16526 [Corchorus olitorius]
MKLRGENSRVVEGEGWVSSGNLSRGKMGSSVSVSCEERISKS